MNPRALQEQGDRLPKNSQLKDTENVYTDASLLFQKENNINDQADYYIQLGNVNKGQHQYALAIEAYQKAAALYQKSYNNYAILKCYMEMGLIYKDFLGNNEEAIHCFESALDCFKKIRKDGKSLPIRPINFFYEFGGIDKWYSDPEPNSFSIDDLLLAISCYFNLGSAYQKQGNYASAYGYFKQIVDAASHPDRKIQSFPADIEINSYLHLGDIYQIWNKHELAISTYDKARYCTYDNYLKSRISYSIGISQQALNKHADAIRSFEQSQALPSNLAEQAKCRYQIAISYQSLNQHNNAIKSFDLVKKELNHVDQADFYYQYAISYACIGKHKSAIKYFNLAKDCLTISSQKKALCHYQIANSYYKNNTLLALLNYDKAISGLADTCIEKADAYFRRGLIHMDQGKLQLAIEDYSEALRLSSTLRETAQFKCHYHLAMIHAQLGNHQQTIEHSTNALLLKPTSVAGKAKMFYYHAKAYQTLGNDKQAIEDYQNALNLDPHIASLFDKTQLRDFAKNHPDFYEQRLKHLLSKDVQKALSKPDSEKKHSFSLFSLFQRHQEPKQDTATPKLTSKPTK